MSINNHENQTPCNHRVESNGLLARIASSETSQIARTVIAAIGVAIGVIALENCAGSQAQNSEVSAGQPAPDTPLSVAEKLAVQPFQCFTFGKTTPQEAALGVFVTKTGLTPEEVALTFAFEILEPPSGPLGLTKVKAVRKKLDVGPEPKLSESVKRAMNMAGQTFTCPAATQETAPAAAQKWLIDTFGLTTQEIADHFDLSIQFQAGKGVAVVTINRKEGVKPNHIGSPEPLADAVLTKLKEALLSQLGKPYKGDGERPEQGGFTSASLARWALNQVNIDIPQGSKNQSNLSGELIKFEDLRPGDLMFFAVRSATPNYVGTYLGNGEFIHVEPSKGVIKTDIPPFYRTAFAYGKRVLGNIPPEIKETPKSSLASTPEPAKSRPAASPEVSKPVAENLSEDELNGMPKEVWEKMLLGAKKYLGTPYKWKTICTDPKNRKTCKRIEVKGGIDCSGFTSAAFDQWAKSLNDEKLNMGAATSAPAQSNLGQQVLRAEGSGIEVFKNLRIGDLIFFKIEENWSGKKKGERKQRDTVSHVAIYIGNGKMMHSGTTNGVEIVALDAWDDYWVDYFAFGGRIFEWKNGKMEMLK